MSVVIDEVEKEISKEYRTRRDSPQCLTIFSKSGQSTCEIFTKNLNSFDCMIYRGGSSTIGTTNYSSSHIINWVKKAL